LEIEDIVLTNNHTPVPGLSTGDRLTYFEEKDTSEIRYKGTKTVPCSSYPPALSRAGIKSVTI
jgi:hypothetical protein